MKIFLIQNWSWFKSARSLNKRYEKKIALPKLSRLTQILKYGNFEELFKSSMLWIR